jgi:flavin-dependent dehydrogenase
VAARHLDPDILIAGGGPAGAAAAIACAQRGLRVVVVERDDFARRRPGEGLHPGVEPVLAQLGVADRLAAVVGARHEGIWIDWAGNSRFEAFGADPQGPWRGFQVDRPGLEALLLERARALGVEVRQPCAVLDISQSTNGSANVETSAGPVRCRIMIDATGPARALSRRLGIGVRVASPRLIAHFGYARGRCLARDHSPALVGDSAGWTWTARVHPDLYQWIRLRFDDARQPHLGAPAEFDGLVPVGAPRGAEVTWKMLTSCAGPGWFAVGDAGAMLCPVSARGVLKALMSGIMAAHLSAGVLRGGLAWDLAEDAYHRWLGGWFAGDVTRLSLLYAQLGVSGFGPD